MKRAGPNGPSGWDAGAYDRLSDPQYAWGQRVIGRLELRGDETVLDAGCGSGRLTALLLERLPHGRVIAVDRSPAMLAAARSNLAAAGRRVTYLCADLQTIVLGRPVDAIFSTATFHWILDHPRLFRALAGVLIPGGRLEAQCGGGPNLARLRARVQGLTKQEPFAMFFQRMARTLAVLLARRSGRAARTGRLRRGRHEPGASANQLRLRRGVWPVPAAGGAVAAP